MRNILALMVKTIVVSVTGVIATMGTFVIALIVLIAVVAGMAAVGEEGSLENLERYQYHYGDPASDTVFLSIPIKGVILGDKSVEDEWSSLFDISGVVYGYQIKELLLEAAENTDIAGIILEIDSPGGTIYGSKAISDGIVAYRESTGKPVVAYVAGMAASGGYWAAASADVIMADSGTGIGSIGVISGPFKYYDEVVSEDGGAFIGGVVTVGGIETRYITAGEHKDIGNPYRQLSAEETASLQGMVNDSYTDFVEHVSNARELEESVVRSQVKALLYGNEQAERLGLIDLTGSKQDAYELLARRYDVPDYQIKRVQLESGFFGTLMSSLSHPQQQSTTILRCPLSSHVLAYHGDLYSLCR